MEHNHDNSSHVTRLAAIMFTDIAGYTALMGKNANKALEILRKNREIHKSAIDHYHGKWLKEMGDGILLQFESAADAVRSAIDIQKKARQELDASIRIGIHLGDITIENEDVFGDGVNIASRLQSIADPGGIYISDSIQHAIRGNTDIRAEYFGAVKLKNVDYLVNTYYIGGEGFPIPSRRKKLSLSGGIGRPVLGSIYTYIAALLILVLAITGWWFKRNATNTLKAIAVLPVENISQQTDQEWLSAGIHHALIDELCKIHSLRVVSRTSTLKFRGRDMAIPEIARELKVDGIVEASYFTEGEKVNLQVRLIKAEPEEKQIWRRSYEQAMQNVYSIYNDVVVSVAEAGNIRLSEEEQFRFSKSDEINPEAYEAYLRGMSHWEKATLNDLDKAMDYFNLSRELDPEYALAYLGIAYVWGARLQHGFMPYEEVRDYLDQASDKAIELDSTLADIHGWMALNYTWWAWEFEKAGAEFQKAIEMNPNYSFALVYYAHYLAITGEIEKGLPYGKLSMELDPFNTLYQSAYGMALKNARKYAEAAEILEDLLAEEPNHGIGLPALWAVYHEQGRYEQALDLARKIFTIKENEPALEALEEGYENGGYRKAMQRIAEEMIASRDSIYFPAWQICTLYARAELKEETMYWMEVAFKEHDSNMPYIGIDPLFDFLREESRFKEILSDMKLPAVDF